MEEYSQSIIAMLAVINPVICGTMLINIQKGQELNANVRAAVKAMAIVMLILLVSALTGKYILSAFGISMEAFKIVGGIIIGFIGIQMMFGLGNNNSVSDDNGDLGNLVMFAASPGTIAMVITLAAVHNSEGIPVVAIIGVIVAVIVTLAIIIMMLFMVRNKKQSSANGFITKFMGLIIVAMGLQFTLDGLKTFFDL